MVKHPDYKVRPVNFGQIPPIGPPRGHGVKIDCEDLEGGFHQTLEGGH